MTEFTRERVERIAQQWEQMAIERDAALRKLAAIAELCDAAEQMAGVAVRGSTEVGFNACVESNDIRDILERS